MSFKIKINDDFIIKVKVALKKLNFEYQINTIRINYNSNI